MAWFVKGEEVANVGGWTSAAHRLVPLRKRGATISSNNDGPVGWKARPAARRHRSLAEMARTYRQRRRAEP